MQTYVSIGALIVSIIVLLVSIFRNGKTDAKTDTSELTTLVVGQETIKDGIREIKTDVREMKAEVKDLHERVVIVEQSTKSAHKRLDFIEKKGTETS